MIDKTKFRKFAKNDYCAFVATAVKMGLKT